MIFPHINMEKPRKLSISCCVKYRNFTSFPGVEILWKGSFRIVSGESPETMQKLCLSIKFPHQEMRWNYGIWRSEFEIEKKICKVTFPALLERLISVFYYKNPNSQNLLLSSEFLSRVYLELCKSTVAKKT